MPTTLPESSYLNEAQINEQHDKYKNEMKDIEIQINLKYAYSLKKAAFLVFAFSIVLATFVKLAVPSSIVVAFISFLTFTFLSHYFFILYPDVQPYIDKREQVKSYWVFYPVFLVAVTSLLYSAYYFLNLHNASFDNMSAFPAIFTYMFILMFSSVFIANISSDRNVSCISHALPQKYFELEHDMGRTYLLSPEKNSIYMTDYFDLILGEDASPVGKELHRQLLSVERNPTMEEFEWLKKENEKYKTHLAKEAKTRDVMKKAQQAKELCEAV